MEVEKRPRVDFDIKCIPRPCDHPQAQRIVDVKQGYIMSVCFSESEGVGILKANGHKIVHAPTLLQPIE